MKNKKITIYTTGVFDILHPGHLNILTKAKALGDRLVVGVQEDKSVFLQKKVYPVMSCKDRVRLLKALPFVDKVITYFDLDQRPILEKIKPDIMVQGDDWRKTGDRTEIIEYLKKKKIKLVEIPYTKGISSTLIKNRTINNFLQARNDVVLLMNSLKIIPINQLRVYENYDPIRTSILTKKIRRDKVFIDPITVANYKGIDIVIDGVNRLQALVNLGIKNILVNQINYSDTNQVELSNNVHYLNLNPEEFIYRLKKNNILINKTKNLQIIDQMEEKKIAAVVKTYNTQYYILIKETNEETVELLNKIVNLYLGKIDVFRLSELGQDSDSFKLKIIFKKFTIDEIYKLILRKQKLNSGITWHKVKFSIVRVKLPLSLLVEVDANLANKKLIEIIKNKIFKKNIRSYFYNIFICDDWE